MAEPICFGAKAGMGLPFFTLIIGLATLYGIVIVSKWIHSRGNFPVWTVAVVALIIVGTIVVKQQMFKSTPSILVYPDHVQIGSLTILLKDIRELREDSMYTTIYIKGRPTPQTQRRLIAITPEGELIVIASEGIYDIDAIQVAIERMMKGNK